MDLSVQAGRRFVRRTSLRKLLSVRHLAILIALFLLAMLPAGCLAQSESLGTTVPTASLSPAVSPTPVVSGTQTAGPTTLSMSTAASSAPTTSAASSEPSATAAPSVQPTAKPTHQPTVKPTAAPTDSGLVTLAEGFYYYKLDDALKARIAGLSYPADPAGCKITYDELRYIQLRYFDFAGNVCAGELIVNVRLADEVLEIFYALYQAKYPLTSVRLVDDFGQPADDTLSMEANNTSAFCYRYVSGTSTLSRHSYGAAIDINPMLNPYLVGGRIVPENGAPYADRSLVFAGKIDHADLCYQLFTAHGWSWGGDWSGDKDYQHFSKKLG